MESQDYIDAIIFQKDGQLTFMIKVLTSVLLLMFAIETIINLTSHKLEIVQGNIRKKILQEFKVGIKISARW